MAMIDDFSRVSGIPGSKMVHMDAGEKLEIGNKTLACDGKIEDFVAKNLPTGSIIDIKDPRIQDLVKKENLNELKEKVRKGETAEIDMGTGEKWIAKGKVTEDVIRTSSLDEKTLKFESTQQNVEFFEITIKSPEVERPGGDPKTHMPCNENIQEIEINDGYLNQEPFSKISLHTVPTASFNELLAQPTQMHFITAGFDSTTGKITPTSESVIAIFE